MPSTASEMQESHPESQDSTVREGIIEQCYGGRQEDILADTKTQDDVEVDGTSSTEQAPGTFASQEAVLDANPTNQSLQPSC